LQQESCLQVIAEAEDGETAVELTQEHLPNVVVLDVGLPGIGGIEACRQIKQRHPDIPVLILTSHAQKSLIERLISAELRDIASRELRRKLWFWQFDR
jgi:two-component system NarL family response regulator